MPNTPETLMLATAVLTVAAVSLTAAGLRRRRYPGWSLWVAAMWSTTAGAAAGTLVPAPAGPVLAEVLLLQWPMLALVGLRRFHPRQAMPGSERIDWWLLAAACALVLAVAPYATSGPDWLPVTCAAGLHLYAAVMIFMAPGGRESTPVQGLGAAMALTGLADVLSTLPGAELLAPMTASLTAATLGSVVLGFVAVTLVSERTERQLRESRQRLRVLANLDPLTQVPNRRRFQELAHSALRDDAPGSAVLALFDVDHFKQLNDGLGHEAGDRALCLVCASVLEHLRNDVPGRHGGDEFVLLLRETNTQDAMRVAARIVADVQRRAPRHQLPRLSLSFGMVQLGRVENIQQALRRADQALYEAKRLGRSRAVTALGRRENDRCSARASPWDCARPEPRTVSRTQTARAGLHIVRSPCCKPSWP